MNKVWGSDAQYNEYTLAAERVDLKYSHHKKRKWWLCIVMQVLINAVMVIIFQYLSVSNQHVVHLK